jgi:1-pyrroline-5-carboxylate dehydrogenase
VSLIVSECFDIRSQASYDKATGYIKKALDAGGKLVSGGLEKCKYWKIWRRLRFLTSLITCCQCFLGSDKNGFYVWPTIIETSDPKSVTMVEEIFGPVLTVYVYEDEDYEKTIDLCDSTTEYALTGAM